MATRNLEVVQHPPEGHIARAMPPRDSREHLMYRLKQQKLTAWYPCFRTRRVATAYIGIGGLLTAIGVWLLELSSQIWEKEVEYSNESVDEATNVGLVEFEVERDMPKPVYIYYQIENFYQNHRRYVSSLDEMQLRGEGPSNPNKKTYPRCHPWIIGGDGRVHYPCGLIAASVFNDSYVIQAKPEGSTEWTILEVNSNPDAIAWSSDVESRFKNVNPEETDKATGVQRQALEDMWILKRFPPVDCVQTEISDSKPYRPVFVAEKTIQGKNGDDVKVANCENYPPFTSSPTCNFTPNFDASDEGKSCDEIDGYKIRHNKAWGVENGHFIAWMRFAGLPTFRKVWGRLEDTIKAKTRIRVHFASNFPVSQFGKKYIVFSSANSFGGQNSFLGYGYIVASVFCIAIGIFQFIMLSPT